MVLKDSCTLKRGPFCLKVSLLTETFLDSENNFYFWRPFFDWNGNETHFLIASIPYIEIKIFEHFKILGFRKKRKRSKERGSEPEKFRQVKGFPKHKMSSSIPQHIHRHSWYEAFPSHQSTNAWWRRHFGKLGEYTVASLPRNRHSHELCAFAWQMWIFPIH